VTNDAQQANDDDGRTTAAGLTRYAYEYIAAARIVDSQHREDRVFEFVSPVPVYFLAYHGIELTLKAYLRYRGVSIRDLSGKRYGHDLKACYRKAKELQLLDHFHEHEDDVLALRLLMDLNAQHQLRYIKVGFKQFPSWAIVEPLAIRLHQAVAPLVDARTFDIRFNGYE
jgi:hypothetical protein